MKTSIVIIALIFINTTALIAEPINQLLNGINTWLLVLAELILFLSYYINNIVKSIKKASEIDFNNILTQKDIDIYF
ncbi:hypothetical protein [Psychroserpens sp. SPM9]|uniref:hypothetical protein n=1 Tax=Psychroserpens sp. SPM9 TaxID=2975598 RepID=UPI0021A46EF4|nr:hypothetical protein [Psychroserpens sp. SPM9]MDG5490722.1 hypothetical protein [Psychroserpens sp. SPM9]